MKKLLPLAVLAISILSYEFNVFAADEQVRQPTKVECRQYQLQLAEEQFLQHKEAEDQYSLVPGYSRRLKRYADELSQIKMEILSDEDPCSHLSEQELRQVVE